MGRSNGIGAGAITCSPRSRACSYSAISSSVGGSDDLRTVFGDKDFRRHAELLEHHLLELLDAQRRLRLGHLVAVQRLGERADPGAQRVHLVAYRGHRRRALVAFGGQHVAVT